MITAEEMRERLAALCLGGSTGLPRRSRDLHVLLASATLWMEPGALYTEPEVNAGLADWIGRGCPSLSIDVVTLRRELVDRLYLDRDDSGASYSPGTGPREWQFADDVAAVDPAEVLETARVEREARKRAYEPAGEEDR
jgi:hypothetical protein